MGKYDWKILLRSGIVGSVVFVIIDVLCLWSIHRGLMAIQAYGIIRRVRRNEPVRLKRSTIPIVSGELLEASALRWRLNLFVMAHLLAIIVAFLVSFGIDGSTEPNIERRTGAPLLYRTALPDVKRAGRMATSQPVATKCKREAHNSVEYYPMAFNVTWNTHLDDLDEFRLKNGTWRFINESSAVCQWNLSPILVITNCPQCHSFLRGHAIESNITFYNRTESEEIAGSDIEWATWDRFHGEYKYPQYTMTVKLSSTQDIRPKDKLLCRTMRPITNRPTSLSWLCCIIVRRTNNSSEATIAYGVLGNSRRSLDSTSHLFQRESSFGTIHNISDVQYIHNSLEDAVSIGSYSLVDIVDRILSLHVIPKPISLVTVEKPVNITVIRPIAWISMLGLTVIAVLIGPLQELLTCISRRQYGVNLSRLMEANTFDALSGWLPEFLAPDSLPEHTTYSQVFHESPSDALYAE